MRKAVEKGIEAKRICGNLFRQLATAAEALEELERVGNLEQAVKETEARLANLQGQVAAAADALTVARGEAEMILADAKSEAEQAKTKAREVVTKAEQKAGDIVSIAKAEEMSAYERRDEALRSLAEAAKAISGKQAELDELDKKIARIKASAAKLLE